MVKQNNYQYFLTNKERIVAGGNGGTVLLKNPAVNLLIMSNIRRILSALVGQKVGVRSHEKGRFLEMFLLPGWGCLDLLW